MKNSNLNRRNKRGRYSSSITALILVSALLIFQIFSFVSSRRSKEDSGGSGLASDKSGWNQHSKTFRDGSNGLKSLPEPFRFNPNTISYDSLQMLGFSPRQAQTIINWRSRGGVFRKREDFARIYSVSPEKYEELRPFISIPEAFSNLSPHRGDSGFNCRPGWQRNSRYEKRQADWDSTTWRQESIRANDTLALKPFKGRTDTIDLNIADSTDLTSLRGIGGYYARQIMNYRQRLGFFYSPQQLLEIPGIDSARYEELKSRVKIALPEIHYDASAASDAQESSLIGADFRQPLAEMEQKQMASHPYIGAYLARSFIFIKKKYGAVALTVENLLRQGVITTELARKLEHYFK